MRSGDRRTIKTGNTMYVSRKNKWVALLLCFFFGLTPTFAMLFGLHLLPARFGWQLIVPVIVMLPLSWLMKRKIQGYTGDCCGATFLLAEIAFFLITIMTWM